MVPENHVVREFFLALVEKHYSESVGLRDEQVCQYVANLLADFCETEEMFKIRNASGKPLTDVGEMLLEADPVYGPAPSFDRERQVRKRIGDYTLFFTGMFPEAVNNSRLRRQRVESLIDFMKAGKESYYIVSKFDQWEYARLAPLFKKLSHDFEKCVIGLNIIKNELAEMQHPIASRAREILM